MNTHGESLLGRAPWVTAGPLDAAQQALVERVRRHWGNGAVGISPVDPAGRLTGPFDLMAASPHVGMAVLEAAESFRAAELSTLERELLILVVAVAERADVMWEGHLAVAVGAGLDPVAAECVRTGAVPRLDEPLRTMHHVARCLTETSDLDDSTFQSAIDGLGWRRLQEVVWLVGLYRALGLAMRVARTPMPGAAPDQGE